MVTDILLFSGGVDSLCAWFYMNKPKCIYINLQTRYSEKEIMNIKKLMKMIPKLKVKIIRGIDLGQFEVGKKAFIPNRNLILASIASNFGDRIIMAGIADDVVSDKSPRAFQSMSDCLSCISSSGKIKVYSPFWKMSKSQIIKWLLKNEKDAEKYLRTSISCYSISEGQCGKCPACLRKAIAFEACKLKIDFFENDVTKYALIIEYISKMYGKNDYTEQRIKESLKVFKKWGWIIS